LAVRYEDSTGFQRRAGATDRGLCDVPGTGHTKPQPAEDGVAINQALQSLRDGVAVMDASIRRRAYWMGLGRRLDPVLVP
jgi:hypothetical protein